MTEKTEKGGPTADARDEWLTVESLDLDAQGVAHKADGMVVFIEGALPFEEVQFTQHR
jgi:23S rRNA (uracil1939-C5)-methyltransferase